MSLLFCPVCKKILLIKELNGSQAYFCSCGFIRPEKPDLSFKEKIKNLEVGEGINEDNNSDEGVMNICKHCGYDKAIALDLGERFTNESNMYLFRCLKCGKVNNQK
jgi:DNA-directed RNA polymerase subunit M/transcription elongation factor TFIIS